MNDNAYRELVTISEASPGPDSLEQIDISLLTPDEGEMLLHLHEAQVISGHQKRKEGEMQMEEALFIILDNNLWYFALNKATGNAFGDEEKPKKEDYLRQLADDLGISRSSIFYKQATFRVSTRGLGLSFDQMEKIGLPALETAKSLVSYSREDGTITDVPGAEIPDDVDLGDHVRQAVMEVAQEVADEHLKPKDFRRKLKERLGIDEPELSFFYVENGNGSFDLGVDYSEPNGNMLRGVIWECNHDKVPQYVLDEMIRKLRMISL